MGCTGAADGFISRLGMVEEGQAVSAMQPAIRRKAWGPEIINVPAAAPAGDQNGSPASVPEDKPHEAKRPRRTRWEGSEPIVQPAVQQPSPAPVADLPPALKLLIQNLEASRVRIEWIQDGRPCSCPYAPAYSS